MSVSARTFQALYVIRERALQDQTTTAATLREFIVERRKSLWGYTQAYISPTALTDLLYRMSVENLIVCDNGVYHLEQVGSQMADLLEGVDACSDTFINTYKETVVQAALTQRARLGQAPANQREIASLTNISLDSVRRGLSTLIDQGKVIEKPGRLQTYVLATPPLSAVGVTDASTPQATLDSTVTTKDDDDIKAALDNIDQGGPTLTPLEAPVPLGALLQDNGPDSEDVTAPEPAQGRTVVDDDDGIAVDDEDDDVVDLDADADDYVDDVDADDDDDDDEIRWDRVPRRTRKSLRVQALAAGMDLNRYLDNIVYTNESRMRRAVNGCDESLVRSLVMGLPGRHPRR